MTGIVIALISGALMSIQGVFNTELTKQTSLWVTSAFVQFSAFLVCLVVWFFTDRTPFSELLHVNQEYMLLSGVIGAVITITVVQAMNHLGPARAAMLIVISQLVVAYSIEVLGLFSVQQQSLEWRRIAGLVLAIIGIVIFEW